MKPIKEKDLETLNEIQENNRAVLEKEKEVNAKVKQMVKEELLKQFYTVASDGYIGATKTTGSKSVIYLRDAELNESFEDYKPAEPLIKDEKIRKAVRAWAEACGADKVAIANNYCLTTEEDEDVEIVFTLPIFEGMDDDDFYTIAELCGEEEE